ncbi:helix-hairpin-helix domain-containing protein [uncultured Alcanivorax sp.]|uniref:ComEA family DNA-binding protein n=1 Tax=Alcanivorax sp. TaxID=1872427 RepID=UPI00260F7FD2|nr:helix-hairpin-helix domain-containing protein [uncultured Alcanivorax sp.]
MKALKAVVMSLLLALSLPALAVEVDAVKDAANTQVENRIDLNTADVTQLQELKGVGPKTAQAIVQWRDSQGPFTNVDQLLAIKGIGEKTLAKMRDSLVVQ